MGIINYAITVSIAYLAKSRTQQCSVYTAKRGFHRQANSVFGERGRIVSDKVVPHPPIS